MNNNKVILYIAFLVIGISGNAQQVKEPGDIKDLTQAFWLSNSNGEVITNNNSTADKSFFAAEKVIIGSKVRLKKGEHYSVILDPNTGRTDVYSLEGAVLTELIRQKILKNQETNVTVTGTINGKLLSMAVVVR